MAIVASRVNVLTATPTQLVAAGSGATSVTIQNGGPNSIAIGGSTVATTTGLILLTTQTVTITPGRNTAVFAIALTADQTSPANTSVLYSVLD
jgi:hypothetical protein